MRVPLFGLETEYAFAALSPSGEPLERMEVLNKMFALARERVPSVPAGRGHGVFFGNAMRGYVDAGHHVELCTGECTTPGEVVRYVEAGDRILTMLAAAVVEENPHIGRVVLSRSNIDYGGSGTTWGCHESYNHKCRPDDMPKELIPHLASRIVYSGAGGFDNLSSGLRFLLSPRVAHLQSDISSDSVAGRGIYHTKDEPLCNDGSHRLHIICGESTCSRLSGWLKIGTTALVVAMIDAGVSPGADMELAFALNAMHRFAADPTCTASAKLRSGRAATAIQIQRHYLEKAEKHLGARFMPAWAEELCLVWRATLDTLESAPASLSNRLEWPIKFALFGRHAARRGFPWETVELWTACAERLSHALVQSGCPPGPMRGEDALERKVSPVPETIAALSARLERAGLSWDGFRGFLDLKKELFAIDARFSELGDDGIFSALRAAGAIDDDVPDVGDVEAGMVTPPAVGRARLRGEAIRAIWERKEAALCYASWSRVVDRPKERALDLRDPFTERSTWVKLESGRMGLIEDLIG